MPSTYTLNNGIELIGTGEQSGTWGATTNTNFDLVDTALDGQVSVTLASAGNSGSPNNLPVSDGSASNGRNRMIMFTDGGDLGATAYVQLTPNDSEKIIYVRNDLSGSRSIILFQGTYNASNDYEVPAGTTAVVYFDGAGSGAVAANVFNNAYFDSLRLGGVSVTAIIDDDSMGTASATNIATSESIKAYVDAQVGAFDSLAEVLAVGNTTGGTDLLVSTGDDITFADASKAIFGAGGDLQISHDGNNSIIDDVGTGNLFIRGTNINLQNRDSDPRENMITAVANGAVTLSHDGSAKLATTSSGVNVTGTITADGLTVNSGGDQEVYFGDDSDGIALANIGANSSVEFGNSQNTGAVGRLEYARSSGKLTYSNGSNGSEVTRLTVANSGDISFYEDTGTTPKFFWDASAESLGIGTSSPARSLDVNGVIRVADNTPVEWGGVTTSISGSSASNTLFFSTSSSERMRITSDGSVGIGTSSPDANLEVSGSSAPKVYITNTDNSINDAQVYGSLEFVSEDGSLTGGKQPLAAVEAINEGGAGSYSALAFKTARGTGAGAITTKMTINSSGNVGIGDTNPSEALSVTGNITATGTVTAGDMFITGPTPILKLTDNDVADEYTIIQNAGGTTRIDSRNGADDGPILFRGDGGGVITEYARFLGSNGNFGIKDTNPSEALSVTGNIKATGAVTAGDVFITGPTPNLTLTDTDTADEYTQIRNSTGKTYIDTRNGAANGPVIFRGVGGGVEDEYARFTPDGHLALGTTSVTSTLASYAAAMVIGDSDTGLGQNADGVLDTFANNQKVMTVTASAISLNKNTTVDGIINTINGTDIDMDSSASGQLKLDGNGYAGAIALNAQGMNIYTNSASRDLIFGTNELARMRIDGSGVISATNLIKTTNNGFEVSSDSSAHYWMRNASGDARALMYRNATANELTLQVYRNSDNAVRAILNIDPENENFTFITGTANRLTVNSTGLNVTGRVDSTGYVVEGVGQGGVGLTHNDGYGNASVTFNHVAGTPEQDGASARITFNTDTASANAAQMDFQIKSSVTSGTAVIAVSKLVISETKVAIADDLQVSNGGIYLGGTAAANKLDDYEEGSWTPVVEDQNSNAASATVAGFYVKVGRIVYATVEANSINTAGLVAGARLYIDGFPFLTTDHAGSPNRTAAVYSNYISFNGGSDMIAAFGDASARCAFLNNKDASNHSPLLVSDVVNTSASIEFSIVYDTA